MESSYAPIRNAAGNVTGIVGVHRDVSRMEEMLKRLQASEQLFRAAFDAMPDVFLIYDASLQVKFINQRGAEILDKSYRDIIGKRDNDLLPPDVIRTYLPTLEQARDSRTT